MQFRRSRRSTLTLASTLILLICFIWIWIVEYKTGGILGEGLSIYSIPALIGLIVFLVMSVVIMFILPPDFNYVIDVTENGIIFKMSKGDHRIIKRTFTITRRYKDYIVLTDGIAKLTIAYNEEVLKFLNEICN